ncbi:unnamed protein product [Acanthoscelides obtectus]|uniref:Uncharacterized protein n=1 Tax=Acanthoscelides obtectus TaxID=200917 RepID=A0A9P0L9K3_ACAOB|nr:unnamed protein product [Acanthoscelides obtectus]
MDELKIANEFCPYLSDVGVKLAKKAKLFALATVGELFYREANKATSICYDNINELDTIIQPGWDVVKDQLIALVQQVRDRNPKIAASSCFDVRLGMMGFVVASVTSYIIVAVQFMLQQNT